MAARRQNGENGILGAIQQNIAAFARQETSGALVLLVATVVALVVANSALGPAYEEFWHEHAGIFFRDFVLDQSLKHWVDDALMALFFFVVGLEIKREFIVGELSTLRGAALPVIAAVGGMLAPAAIYLLVNAGTPTAGGWGVPMATDIAFALGVLALLGSRAPDGLKVFLAALAIADDIGAILVIAIFYSQGVNVGWLVAVLLPLMALILMNRIGVDEPLYYLIVGSVLWFCMLNSGIHATIAGVIAAFTIPAKAKLLPLEFTNVCRIKLDEIEELDEPGAHTLKDNRQQKRALEIRDAAIRSTAPLQRLEFALHPVSAFLVLPLFALANADIRFVGVQGLGVHAVGIGVFLGLVVGKPLGITLATWLSVRLGFADLPTGVGWPHIVGAGMLGGIGFTMSLFVANLAFRAEGVETEAKIFILAASVVAGILGYVWLRLVHARSATRTAEA